MKEIKEKIDANDVDFPNSTTQEDLQGMVLFEVVNNKRSIQEAISETLSHLWAWHNGDDSDNDTGISSLFNYFLLCLTFSFIVSVV